jgi:hypothetical protein
MGILMLTAFLSQFHYGIKGGVTLTPDLDRFRLSQAESSVRVNRGTIGPFVEYQPFKRPPAIETGLMYRRLRTDSYYGPFPNSSLNYITRTLNVFDIPLLLKARHKSLYASAGSTIRRLGDYNQTYLQIPLVQGFNPTLSSLKFTNEDRMRYGITAALGYSRPLWRVALEPELRYTRWTSLRQIPYQNQIDLMLGVRF